MSSLEPFTNNIDLLLQATPGKPSSAGFLDNEADPDSGHSELWTNNAAIITSTDTEEEFRRASYTEAPFFTPPGAYRDKKGPSLRRAPSSDSTDAGVDFPEGQGDDAMSPSLSSTCVETNGTSVESMIQQALAEQALEHQARLAEKDSKIKELEAELANANLAQKEKDQPRTTKGGCPTSEADEGLIRVLAEYELTMASYIEQMDDMALRLKESDREKLEHVKERDQALEDLGNVENAFSGVHRKYERLKGICENFRKNEEMMKERDASMTETIANQKAYIEELKEKCKSHLEVMHGEFEAKQKELENDVVRLKAQLRKAEMRVDTLTHDVEQKTREVTKLNGLCDELINQKIN